MSKIISKKEFIIFMSNLIQEFLRKKKLEELQELEEMLVSELAKVKNKIKELKQ